MSRPATPIASTDQGWVDVGFDAAAPAPAAADDANRLALFAPATHTPAPAVPAADLAAVRAALPRAPPPATVALLAAAADKLEDRLADALATAASVPVLISGLRAKLAAVRAVAADAEADAVTYTPPTLADGGFKGTGSFHWHLIKVLTDISNSSGCAWHLGGVLCMGWPASLPSDKRVEWLEAQPDVWVVGNRVMRAGDTVPLKSGEHVNKICKIDGAVAAAAVAAEGPDLTAILAARVTALEAEAASLRARLLEAERGAAAVCKHAEQVQAAAQKMAAKMQGEAGKVEEK